MRPAGVRLIEIGDADGLARAILEVLRAGKKQKSEKQDDWSNIDRVIEIYEKLLNKKTLKETASVRNQNSVIRNS
jgi:hypothetical protein